MKSQIVRVIVLVSLVVCVAACDQFFKTVVRRELTFGEYQEVIGSSFMLTNVENTGAMLGLGADLPYLSKLLLLALLPLVLLTLLFIRVLIDKDISWDFAIAFACVIGGGVGNLYDRIFRGSVTDFMYIDLGVLKTGIFNVADVAVTIGLLVLMAMFYFEKRALKIFSVDFKKGI